MVIEVSNADRIVFPEVNKTKGDVVAYYDRISERALPHVLGRPLSMKRYPKGLAGPGFFQKNVPDHYPASIERVAIPRSKEATKKHRGKGKEAPDETVYPVLTAADQFAYVANQGAIELHVPSARLPDLHRPDRIVIDLDPPPDALALVRRAALMMRALLEEHGLPTAPVATGSKGYHLVAPITTSLDAEAIMTAVQQLSALAVSKHPDELTVTFRVAQRGKRVFVDWLRNAPLATFVTPYSVRARPRASVALPIAWSELETIAPDAFTIADVEKILDRADPLAELSTKPAEPKTFVSSVAKAFEASGLVLETFDRFRS
jgi:bifunctional non-homologous end joining protein LigD